MKRSSQHQALIILGLLIITLTGCVNYKATEQEKDQLYIVMLQYMKIDGCKLDEAECQKKFEDWQNSDFGRDIIRHYESRKDELKGLIPHAQETGNSVFCDSVCKKKVALFLQLKRSGDFEVLIQHEAVLKALKNIQ